MKKTAIISAFLISLAVPVWAVSIVGRVTAVDTGDKSFTIERTDGGGGRVTVRLADNVDFSGIEKMENLSAGDSVRVEASESNGQTFAHVIYAVPESEIDPAVDVDATSATGGDEEADVSTADDDRNDVPGAVENAAEGATRSINAAAKEVDNAFE